MKLLLDVSGFVSSVVVELGKAKVVEALKKGNGVAEVEKVDVGVPV